MLKTPNAETLMQDARTIHAEAEALTTAGDWRNAAEKGWLAATAATAALVWSITGVHHHTETDISLGIGALSYRCRGEYTELSIWYGYFTHNLLYEAFYDSVYYEDLPDLIREVADYIARAEQLAETDPPTPTGP